MSMDDRQMLFELRRSIDLLAEEIDDEPEVASALRRFASCLPRAGSSRARRVADGRPFWRGPAESLDPNDLAPARARRTRRYSPPLTSLSKSSSSASSAGGASTGGGGLTAS